MKLALKYYDRETVHSQIRNAIDDALRAQRHGKNMDIIAITDAVMDVIFERGGHEVSESFTLELMQGEGADSIIAYRKVKFARRVIISSSGGFWRENARGYCCQHDAGVFTGSDALDHIWHLGPEKHARIHILKD